MFETVLSLLRDGKKGVITKGVFSLEESLESPKSLNSLESLEHGRILVCFPQSWVSLESLESLNSLETLENGLSWKDPFSKRPLFPNPNRTLRNRIRPVSDFWKNQKKPHVRNFAARRSGAGNGCAKFMGAWHFLVLSARKPPMPIALLVLGGGVWFFFEGGWKCPISFFWAWGLL